MCGLQRERASKTQKASFKRSRTRSAQVVPDTDRRLIVDNIGLPARAYNLAFTDGSTIGPNDGVIMVALKSGHAPTADYVRKLREVLPTAFPDVVFYFQAADIVTQILNFGLPSQIDVQGRRRRPGQQSQSGARAATAHRRHSRHCRRPSPAGN